MSMLLLFSAAAACGAAITVTQPVGGTVTMGCHIQVQWTASGVSSSVKILLRKSGGALVGTIAANLPVSPGLYNWTVAAPAVAGESYKIHVRASDGSAEGESASFTVVQGADPVPGSITNVHLSGNSPYCLGTNYTVSWTVSNVAQHLKLELIKSGAVNSSIASDLPPDTSSKNWTAAGTAASDYRVRVSAIGGPATAESAVFELKTCSGIPGLHPGDMKEFKAVKPGGASVLAEKLKGTPGFKIPVAVPGVYRNYPCHDTFPTVSIPIPASVLQQGWQLLENAGCGVNDRAEVGIYWFPYENIQVAAIYRSRIIFYLSEHVQPGATLESAKLKMKRTHSIHEDASSGCGCTENLWVLEAPMTNYVIPAIGQRIDIDMGAAEFTKDITGIVRQWLDGSLANNGLLLLAGALPCSGGRRCSSCYEASLLLYMK